MPDPPESHSEMNDSNIFGGKTVLVTGGTGTFGSAFCKRLQSGHDIPNKIIVFSRGWIPQQALRDELGDPSNMRWFIGDVRDVARLKRAFHDVDYVVHAAAMKDIVSAQYNPREALLTNTCGTMNVIEAALECGVEKVVFISSDKAVGAANVYGKSKALAEDLIIQGNAYAGGLATRFASVRYGNVIGSAGSVLHVFRAQKPTGKITITDKRMTRFWLSIDQAIDTVFKALETMRGGEIFVPAIPSMQVAKLAFAFAPECQQIEIGIRPGEKLHEVLISEDEARHTLISGAFYKIMPENPQWSGTEPLIGIHPIDGWSYRSDTNTDFLSTEEIKRAIVP